MGQSGGIIMGYKVIKGDVRFNDNVRIENNLTNGTDYISVAGICAKTKLNTIILI